MSKSSQSAILDRRQPRSEASRDAVRWLADFKFPRLVNERMQILMDKNSAGTIATYERKELEMFVEAGDLIGIAKLSARNLLKENE